MMNDRHSSNPHDWRDSAPVYEKAPSSSNSDRFVPIVSDSNLVRQKFGNCGEKYCRKIAQQLVTLGLVRNHIHATRLCEKAIRCIQIHCVQTDWGYEVFSQSKTLREGYNAFNVVYGDPGELQQCTCTLGFERKELCSHKLASFLFTNTKLSRFPKSSRSSKSPNASPNSKSVSPPPAVVQRAQPQPQECPLSVPCPLLAIEAPPHSCIEDLAYPSAQCQIEWPRPNSQPPVPMSEPSQCYIQERHILPAQQLLSYARAQTPPVHYPLQPAQHIQRSELQIYQQPLHQPQPRMQPTERRLRRSASQLHIDPSLCRDKQSDCPKSDRRKDHYERHEREFDSERRDEPYEPQMQQSKHQIQCFQQLQQGSQPSVSPRALHQRRQEAAVQPSELQHQLSQPPIQPSVSPIRPSQPVVIPQSQPPMRSSVSPIRPSQPVAIPQSQLLDEELLDGLHLEQSNEGSPNLLIPQWASSESLEGVPCSFELASPQHLLIDGGRDDRSPPIVEDPIERKPPSMTAELIALEESFPIGDIAHFFSNCPSTESSWIESDEKSSVLASEQTIQTIKDLRAKVADLTTRLLVSEEENQIISEKHESITILNTELLCQNELLEQEKRIFIEQTKNLEYRLGCITLQHMDANARIQRLETEALVSTSSNSENANTSNVSLPPVSNNGDSSQQNGVVALPLNKESNQGDSVDQGEISPKSDSDNNRAAWSKELHEIFHQFSNSAESRRFF